MYLDGQKTKNSDTENTGTMNNPGKKTRPMMLLYSIHWPTFCTLYRYMNTFVSALERRDGLGPYRSRLRITGPKL